jgi:phage gp16-like protein
MPNRQISQKQIALLHVAKAQLGLSEEVYREMLGSVGVFSSVQLTEPKFDELMRRMEAGGFRTVSRKPKGARAWKIKAGSQLELQLGKIKALLTVMKLPDSYADGIARQQWGVDRVEWCRPDQLRGVIAALMRHQKRAKTVKSEASGVKSEKVAGGSRSRLTPNPSRERSDHAV